MLNSIEFVALLRAMPATQRTERHLMTRVLLNTVADPAAYPVDLSEVLGLPGALRAVTVSFMANAAANLHESVGWTDDYVRLIRSELASLETPDV